MTMPASSPNSANGLPGQLSEPPLENVTGKAAFITGGSSGIGLGIAQACAEAGMRVVLTFKTPANRDRAMEILGNPAVHAIALDVTDRDAMSRAADEAARLVGDIHLLCSNAGIGIRTRIVDASFDDWDFATAVNIGGMINAVQTFLPRMLRHGEPSHIVGTSSMSGLFHGGTAGIYTTTKFAVVGMMEALRTDLMSTNIGVSVLCPGFVESNIGQWHRNLPSTFSRPSPEPQRPPGTALQGAGMSPLECGRKVLAGIRRNDMYILTHREFEGGVADRHDAIAACFKRQRGRIPKARVRAESFVLRGRAYALEKDRGSKADRSSNGETRERPARRKKRGRDRRGGGTE